MVRYKKLKHKHLILGIFALIVIVSFGGFFMFGADNNLSGYQVVDSSYLEVLDISTNPVNFEYVSVVIRNSGSSEYTGKTGVVLEVLNEDNVVASQKFDVDLGFFEPGTVKKVNIHSKGIVPYALKQGNTLSVRIE